MFLSCIISVLLHSIYDTICLKKMMCDTHPYMCLYVCVLHSHRILVSIYATGEEIYCPGLGQDRVNFHRTPGRGTAGRADPTPPGQTEQGIPYHVPSRWVPVGGSGVTGTHSWLGRAERRFGPGERGSVLLVCSAYSPYLYCCCSCSLCLLFC